MSPDTIRGDSIAVAKRLGYPVNPALPLIGDGSSLRSKPDAVSRLLSLHAVCAAAWGFDRQRALSWLKGEQLIAEITEKERAFLDGSDSSISRFRCQVEALWALSWALSLAPALSFAERCPSTFVSLLPDLKSGQGGGSHREKAHLRAVGEVHRARDLAYVLHWGLRESALEGRPAPGNVPEYVVTERRLALEWLLSQEAWDDISMDT